MSIASNALCRHCALAVHAIRYLLTFVLKHPPPHSLTLVTTVRSLWRNYYKFKGYIVQCQMATAFSELHLLLEDNHVHICHWLALLLPLVMQYSDLDAHVKTVM